MPDFYSVVEVRSCHADLKNAFAYQAFAYQAFAYQAFAYQSASPAMPERERRLPENSKPAAARKRLTMLIVHGANAIKEA
jgi:hypothetical protein